MEITNCDLQSRREDGTAPVLLPQQIYRLIHEGFAEPLDNFPVPIARDAGGFAYEAVFT